MADSDRIGPYRVIERLGSGGMGEVVLAHDDRLDRFVAIKRLHDKHADAHHSRERFRREARIVARLNHPAIVQLHDVLRQGDHDFLIMEYVEGRTLRARRDAGPMTVSELLGIGHQIALGMAAAHELGVIHRDLKAENVLITRAGRAKIADFGIAKLHGDDNLTADEAVVGTFRSMSPEQALGRPVDHRSDLFSFGILLYETLAGESPFHADSPYLIVQRLVNDEPRPIAELVPGIPDELARLIHQLLAKEPVLRPRDFHEVAEALIELAGQACDMPCHAGPSAGNRPPRPGEDIRPTDETAAPSPPPDDAAAIDRASGGDADDAPVPHTSGSDSDDDGRRTARLRGDRSLSAYAPTLARVTRRRRAWRAAGLGIAAMTALGVGYAVRAELVGAPRKPYLRVAVLAPHVSGADGHPEIASLAVAVRNAVTADVRARVGLDLVPRGDIETYVEGVKRDTGRPPAQGAIRTAVGADEVIATDIECVAGSCTVTLERDAGAPGGPPSRLFHLAADSTARPGETVAYYLSLLYPDHPPRHGAAIGSIDPDDHERFGDLVEHYWGVGDTRSSGELIAELDGIRKRAPRSLDVLLFEAEVLRHRYLETEDPADAECAMARLQDADRLFPDSYDILSARFDLVLSVPRLDNAEARRLLDRLIILDPDSSATHLQQAKLHYALGELAQARRELDAAARRDAFSWRVDYYRARVSWELRDRDTTRAAIARLLDRSPGNYGGLSLRAREERESGQLVCAEQTYAGLVAREPLYYECVNLGYTRNQLGQYRAASDSFRCALAIRPGDPAAQLNVAESMMLAGDGGVGDPLRALHATLVRKRGESPDGTLRWTDRLVEAQTLAYLGRSDRALADEARRRASELLTPPIRSGALFTAALVHAVLGDRNLAAAIATKYLDGGGSTTEFGFPWFDALRNDPVLGPRLTVPVVAQRCEPTPSP